MIEHNKNIQTNNNINKTILVIDDDNYLRSTIANLLLKNGYNVIAYNNPNDAISYAMQIQPDLILMDYVMEPISGLDAADILKRNRITMRIPIIIMSANYLNCRHYPFIQKPLSSEILCKTIRTYLNNIYF